MRSYLSILLIVVLFFFLSACASESTSGDSQKEQEENQQQAEVDPDFPSKPIRMVMPYGPGGSTDIIFRLIATEAEKHLGQTIVPENMEGAGATLGATHVKEATPDGYTILASHDTIAISNITGVTDYSFEAFEPISLLTRTINIPAVNSDSGITNVEELLEFVKENPDEANFSNIPGSTSYFFIARFMTALGLSTDDVNWVNYDDTPGELNGLLGGDTLIASTSVATTSGYYEEGSIVPLGVANDERLSEIPDVPTLLEQDVDLISSTNRGIFAPLSTPQEHIDIIAEAFEKALESEELQEKINGELGSVVDYLPPEEYAEFLSDTEKNLTEAAENLE